MSVLNELIQFLEEGRKQKLAIFCVGNILKADDGLGPVIAENLTGRIDSDILLIDVGSQPENFVSVLKRNKVTHCLLIDATNFEAEAGQIGIFEPGDLEDFQVTFSTHFLSLNKFMDFMETESGTKFKLLGIQPKDLAFGNSLSPEIEEAIRKTINLLVEHLK